MRKFVNRQVHRYTFSLVRNSFHDSMAGSSTRCDHQRYMNLQPRGPVGKLFLDLKRGRSASNPSRLQFSVKKEISAIPNEVMTESYFSGSQPSKELERILDIPTSAINAENRITFG